mmetsp:Transcript_19754/g.42000  ORF Transcript_19754/g.42000 Transcript_19754/m.42000 type:complete len:332 (-) Transcript_19754:391-1386(-)
MAEHRDKRVKPSFVLNPMDEQLQRKCDALIKMLLKRNQGVHFSAPVDWKKLKLDEYPKLIKQPMDLGTVQEKVSSSKYERLEDFANDIRLVWKNAFIFNTPDSMYFKAAKQLGEIFEKKMEEIEKDCEVHNPPPVEPMERCNLLLADMIANPLSEWFREPVDYVKLELADYPKVIAVPMDLGTVEKKILRGQYMSPEDYAHDVRLVWTNAITYNSATSMFGVVATILSQIFERRFTLTRSAATDPGRPIPDRNGWPTFTAKKKFYDLCTKLTLADLNQMVSLVQNHCAKAVQQCGDKEVEVDVDELDMETFSKVLNWASNKNKSSTKAESS